MQLADIGWRSCIEPHINMSGALYEFGVFTGKSIVELLHIYRNRNIEITKIYGLDSFEGLPGNDPEPPTQPGWVKGEFDSRKWFSVNTKEEAVKKVENFISPYLGSTEFVPVVGYYDALTEKDIKKYGMEPAVYIDLDCDLYMSSYQALDFMFNNRLVKPGCLIGCDDFGGSPGWLKCLDGQSRAFKEICEKYWIDGELLDQRGGSYPHVHSLFRIKSYRC